MALRVVRALFDGVRDGLLVFFVGVVLFRAAAAGYFITLVVVAAAVRVVAEASITAVSRFAGHASRGGVVLYRLGAGRAGGQNHFDFDWGLEHQRSDRSPAL